MEPTTPEPKTVAWGTLIASLSLLLSLVVFFIGDGIFKSERAPETVAPSIPVSTQNRHKTERPDAAGPIEHQPTARTSTPALPVRPATTRTDPDTPAIDRIRVKNYEAEAFLRQLNGR